MESVESDCLTRLLFNFFFHCIEPDKDETKEEEKKSQEKEGMGENEAEKDKKVEKQADDELKVVEESKAGDEKKESEAKGERVPPPMLTQACVHAACVIIGYQCSP